MIAYEIIQRIQLVLNPWSKMKDWGPRVSTSLPEECEGILFLHFVAVKKLKIKYSKYFAILFKLFFCLCSYLQRWTTCEYDFWIKKLERGHR